MGSNPAAPTNLLNNLADIERREIASNCPTGIGLGNSRMRENFLRGLRPRPEILLTTCQLALARGVARQMSEPLKRAVNCAAQPVPRSASRQIAPLDRPQPAREHPPRILEGVDVRHQSAFKEMRRSARSNWVSHHLGMAASMRHRCAHCLCVYLAGRAAAVVAVGDHLLGDLITHARPDSQTHAEHQPQFKGKATSPPRDF